jgi:hypothetical protein
MQQYDNDMGDPDGPLLLCLVTERRYTEALSHLKEHGVDEDSGAPTLNGLARLMNPTPEAIEVAEVICSMLPQLTRLVVIGNALCVCIKAANSPMALTLIRASPQVCRETCRGGFGDRNDPRVDKTVFHVACEANADIIVLKAILREDPTMASQATVPVWVWLDRLSTVNLNSLAMSYLDSQSTFGGLNKMEIMEISRMATRTPKDVLEAHNDESSLDKVALLLLTQFKGRFVDPLPMHHLLHAACSVACPWACLDRILEEYSAQASQKDDRGNLPLHYAVQNWWNNDDNVANVKKILKVNPEALVALDGETRLPPALLLAAATNSHKSMIMSDNLSQLSLTFELLLAAPEIVGWSLA